MIEIGDYIMIKDKEIYAKWENDILPDGLKVIDVEYGAMGKLLKVNQYFEDSEGNKKNLIYEGFVEKDVYKSRLNIINNLLNEDDDKEH